MDGDTGRGYTLCEVREVPKAALDADAGQHAALAVRSAGRPRRGRRHRSWLISPERFVDLRHSCLLSDRKDAAAYLGVCVRTIRHWDAGRCRVPWSVVRLLRLRRAGELGGLLDGWEGWTIWRDRLVSPDGRVFLERHMRQLWLTLTQAAMFRDDYVKANPPRPVEAVHISTGRPRKPAASGAGRWVCGQAGDAPSPAADALRVCKPVPNLQGGKCTVQRGGGADALSCALGFITIATSANSKGETAEECGVRALDLTPERHQNDVTFCDGLTDGKDTANAATAARIGRTSGGCGRSAGADHERVRGAGGAQLGGLPRQTAGPAKAGKGAAGGGAAASTWNKSGHGYGVESRPESALPLRQWPEVQALPRETVDGLKCDTRPSLTADRVPRSLNGTGGHAPTEMMP